MHYMMHKISDPPTIITPTRPAVHLALRNFLLYLSFRDYPEITLVKFLVMIAYFWQIYQTNVDFPEMSVCFVNNPRNSVIGALQYTTGCPLKLFPL